jgi:hypothetical protein
MKAVKKKKPRQVPGHVIGISTLKMVVMMVVCTVLFFVGMALVVAWSVREGMSVWALIMGIFMLLVCPAAVGMGIYRLRIKERLILGADCFQVVHRVRGEDEVVTQIPYANVTKITLETGEQSNYVGIDLAEPDEPKTYDRRDSFQSTKSVRGCHYVIDEGFTEDLGTIYAMLKERLERHEAAQQK